MAAFDSGTCIAPATSFTIYGDVWPSGESWRERIIRVKWEKEDRMHQARMAAMVMARDDRPIAQRRPRSRPRSSPDLSHRQRCPRLRAPIPQYDRRSM